MVSHVDQLHNQKETKYWDRQLVGCHENNVVEASKQKHYEAKQLIGNFFAMPDGHQMTKLHHCVPMQVDKPEAGQVDLLVVLIVDNHVAAQ